MICVKLLQQVQERAHRELSVKLMPATPAFGRRNRSQS